MVESMVIPCFLSLLSFIGVMLIFFIKKLFVQTESLTNQLNALNVKIEVLKAQIERMTAPES